MHGTSPARRMGVGVRGLSRLWIAAGGIHSVGLTPGGGIGSFARVDPGGVGTESTRDDPMKQLISKKVASAIHAQIGQEFLASLQYEAIAAWFKLEGLPRLSAHFAAQATEERMHAHRFIAFLNETGTPLEIPAIPAPQCRFKTALQAVELALEHELKVTDSIKALLDLAESEGDRFTENSLQWFITEQLEEVSSADELVQMVRRAGDGGLLFVEHFLATSAGGAARGG